MFFIIGPLCFGHVRPGRAQAHGPPPLLFFAIINSHGHIVLANGVGGRRLGWVACPCVCLVTVEGRHVTFAACGCRRRRIGLKSRPVIAAVSHARTSGQRFHESPTSPPITSTRLSDVAVCFPENSPLSRGTVRNARRKPESKKIGRKTRSDRFEIRVLASARPPVH